MKRSTFWILVAVAGLLLATGPMLWRYMEQQTPQAAYTPPTVPTAAVAATPIPTATPLAVAQASVATGEEVRRGPVVVDLAHYSAVERNRFQPLASALAEQGVDLRFWLPTISLDNVTQFSDFPDQSETLQRELSGASALVVVSPYFLYSAKEVQVVEQFLADGGRLLIISDPDVESDAARDTNSLAAPLNIVFNEDYLYDTVDNDENYTYFFQGDFFDQAEALAGSRIAFYGGRSIDGAVIPQVRSASTTLSSLRTGQTGFTTGATGGVEAGGSLGRVLALSDFDVLTDPYVARHDNRRLLAFVAEFLAGGERNHSIADFPAALGKEVALVIDDSAPVGAQGLVKAAELQRVLELSGRQMRLGPTTWVSNSIAADGNDLIYVASYEAAERDTPLLADLGLSLVTEIVTPTASAPVATPAVESNSPAPAPATTPAETPAATPTPTMMPELPQTTPAPEIPPVTPGAADVTATATVVPVSRLAQAQAATPAPTETPSPAPEATPEPATGESSGTPEAAATATPAPDVTEPVAPPAPTPTEQVYLVREDGIRLLADETQLFVQRAIDDEHKILAVLGESEAAINAGLTRLLTRDLTGCLIQDELVICPYVPGTGETSTAAPAAAAQAPAGESATLPAKDGDPAPAGDDSSQAILIVDDNRNAAEGEIGEAELYAALLAAAGYQPTLWSTNDSGYPAVDKLQEYAWIIWSDAIYSNSGLRGQALQTVGDAINAGAKVTVSSRMPFFGVSAEPASPIVDVVIGSDVPELVEGISSEPIALPAGLPDVVPLNSDPEPSTGARIAMRRGPASKAGEAPVLMVYSDENFDEPKGAKLMLFGMSIAWLPDDLAPKLVESMAAFMLAE